eukprot:CAMPEP_0172297866 /NCGR_PEP_ID=MMETSP1058-20130122/740_1 /TAXON_ID=83371 /ORGANISM="Detonula confervacea, Strain CCMP 353" /LENGTH=85 /DNA_ID=CAMNT_0013007069 /DNA_START=38 /DNA_END=292 /DNA_ORIENTATION=+
MDSKRDYVRRSTINSIDWGSIRNFSMRNLSKKAPDADIASRYDPTFIRRIMSCGDIDDDSSDNAEVAGNDGNKKRNQACRQAIVI